MPASFSVKIALSKFAKKPAMQRLFPQSLFSSTTAESRGEQLTRASKVQLLGVNDAFWEQIKSEKVDALQEDHVVLNSTLAQELAVKEGDEITILITDPSGIPSDNPLGKRDDKTVSLPRQTVAKVLPDQSVGGLSFLSNQTAPRNIFASLATIQDILDLDGKINASLVLTPDDNQVAGQELCDRLNIEIKPSLEDFGLALDRHRRIFPDPKRREKASTSTTDNEQVDGDDQAEKKNATPEVIFDYLQLSASQLVIDQETSKRIRKAVADDEEDPLPITGTITYLANSIAKVSSQEYGYSSSRKRLTAPRQQAHSISSTLFQDPDLATEPPKVPRLLSREVTYSIVVGVDGPLFQTLADDYYDRGENRGWLREPFCWVNSWLAEQIDVKPSEWLEITYYSPETVDGQKVEETQRLMVAGIVPLVEPIKMYQRSRPAIYDKPPTIFNDPNLTPSVPGITDQDSIRDWDLPFKLEKDVPDADDDYWENHRLTPKIFLPRDYAEDFFESRFGQDTGFRVALNDVENPDEFEQILRRKIEEALLTTRESKGLVFTPVRERQLAAASGTTPFDALFLSLSFFVIVAALLLVYLLFKLSVQQRRSELGILQAQGFTPARIRNLLLSEFAVVSLIGAAVGIGLGLLYARAIIAGLESWWIGAISTRFLVYLPKWPSMLIGGVCGFGASLLAIYAGLRRACKVEPLSNLRGQEPSTRIHSRFGKHVYLGIAIVLLLAALGLGAAALGQTGMAKAGTFFGSGMLMLGACMFGVRQLIDLSPGSKDNGNADKDGEDLESKPSLNHMGSLPRMALKTIGRNPSRSLLSLSLLSVATFLIASMGVFQLSPTERGYGGFDLIGESSQPVYENIGFGSVRSDRLGDEARTLVGSNIVPLRAKYGEDASCNNLFQVVQPTVLGVPPRLAEIHDYAASSIEFEWAASERPNNPWTALKLRSSGTEFDPIPVILDQNTAMWSLKQGASLDSRIVLEIDNRKIHFKTVGLLSNSVLQGKLLISEENFQFAFPQISGYSFFLINTDDKKDPAKIASALETGWAQEGMDVTYSTDLLKKFLGVQNTYISAFQSLGALGLLLGTFGLVAVQIRSVLERRREFALMRAVGFSSNRLAKILTMETAILLVGGMLIGILCAAVALTPFIIEVGPQLTLVGPILMLLGVLLVGSVAAILAIRAANKQSVLEGLRSE